MRTFRVVDQLDEEQLCSCVEALRGGGILCYPTETFYALGVDATEEEAKRKVYELKGRNPEKNLPLIAGDLSIVQHLCDTSHPKFQTLSKRFWPGPLTLVLPAHNAREEFAIRISSNPVARQLSQALDRPIISTSANLSGTEPLSDPQNLPEGWAQKLEILIDAGPSPGGAPSTIISLLRTEPQILREGIISAEDILSIL